MQAFTQPCPRVGLSQTSLTGAPISSSLQSLQSGINRVKAPPSNHPRTVPVPPDNLAVKIPTVMSAGAQNPNRRQEAFNIRVSAAHLARDRVHPPHLPNEDESSFRSASNEPSYIASFTKGLPHVRESGLLASARAFHLFVKSIDSADPRDFRDVPLGPPIDAAGEQSFVSGIAQAGNPFTEPAKVRAWESAGAGSTFDLQGPDAQAVTMPPAPRLESEELVLEMAELYWMALLRDVSFADFACSELVRAAIASLNNKPWVKNRELVTGLSDAERARQRGPFDVGNVFRGVTRGDEVGPYISQFLLAGTAGLGNANDPAEGFVMYGANRIDQRVRVAEPKRDYMTTFEAWLDVQNGADVRGREVYVQEGARFRFITTPRDLATYVHVDQLYQAYLNACLILLDIKAPFDEGIPFQESDDLDKQQGFAVFGGPHILTLVTEVTTRALKAVRYQKFNVHRRTRPEAVGGLLDRFMVSPGDETLARVEPLFEGLGVDLLEEVLAENSRQNKTLSDNGKARLLDLSAGVGSGRTLLLPMAFPEGSPMHPSYGAGHGVVAGACVTILKAFFDSGYELPFAFVPSVDGSMLETMKSDGAVQKLTVEGELNKLCSNLSIGRNWAGVHYFSDYLESIRLGESVALGILEEQKLTYGENFSMTIPLFDGSVRRI